jgi:hypothetical protein
MRRSRLASATLLPIPLVAAVLVLAACSQTTAPGGESGTPGGTGSGGSALDCDGVTTAGWELFVDPRLTVEPSAGVVSLAKSGESLAFTDTAPVGFTTYGYQLGYVDAKGTVFPNRSAIFVGAEDTGTFQLDGPFAPSGVDGGPYAGILQIDATDDSGVHPLARVCVVLATSE